MAKTKKIGGEVPTNGAKNAIEGCIPYHAELRIEGMADYLYHRWNPEAVELKASAAKNSKAKKSDDIETFVYRDEKGNLAIPGEQLRMAIVEAARYKADPRSPRKSAKDLFKAAFVILNPLSSLGQKKWDYEDKRRVVVQRNSINRIRPALQAGWTAQFTLLVNLPEYLDPSLLHEVIVNAGRLCGIGDFRPTYGRFSVVSFTAY